VNERSGRRCAVVYNPIKMSDDLCDAITRHAKEAAGATRSGGRRPLTILAR
jgi:hypothetical protein